MMMIGPKLSWEQILVIVPPIFVPKLPDITQIVALTYMWNYLLGTNSGGVEIY